MTVFYEKVTHEELDFPITFEIQHLTPLCNQIAIHWHESMEIIQFVEGTVNVMIESDLIVANPGDTLIINSNDLHSFSAISKNCTYNYLKIDTSFFKNFHIDIESFEFKTLLRDDYLDNLLGYIKLEFLNEGPYFKAKIKAEILNVIIYLIRNYIKAEKNLFGNMNITNIFILPKRFYHI